MLRALRLDLGMRVSPSLAPARCAGTLSTARLARILYSASYQRCSSASTASSRASRSQTSPISGHSIMSKRRHVTSNNEPQSPIPRSTSKKKANVKHDHSHDGHDHDGHDHSHGLFSGHHHDHHEGAEQIMNALQSGKIDRGTKITLLGESFQIHG